MKLDAINADSLLRCCGSRRWVGLMLARLPFASADDVLAAADDADRLLDRNDWLEAFAAHPRIGEVGKPRRELAKTADWSAAEQAGAASASEDVRAALEKGNRSYFAKFGYIFIVCAAGRSASEMFGLLQSRLAHDPETELRIAAAEQAKITRLRLEKL